MNSESFKKKLGKKMLWGRRKVNRNLRSLQEKLERRRKSEKAHGRVYDPLHDPDTFI